MCVCVCVYVCMYVCSYNRIERKNPGAGFYALLEPRLLKMLAIVITLQVWENNLEVKPQLYHTNTYNQAATPFFYNPSNNNYLTNQKNPGAGFDALLEPRLLKMLEIVIALQVCISIYLSICPSIYLYLYVYVYLDCNHSPGVETGLGYLTP